MWVNLSSFGRGVPSALADLWVNLSFKGSGGNFVLSQPILFNTPLWLPVRAGRGGYAEIRPRPSH
jgi:hypothetical protein